ncbi:hypothetical protein Dimus_034956 [Dionaea muscipula]
MAKQLAPIVFLEDWLRVNSGINGGVSASASSSGSSSAQTIIQSWAELRKSQQERSFQPHHVESMKSLLNFQSSLFVADPQAKLLLSLLSSDDLSLPRDSYPLFLRLFYIWARKSSRPSSALIDSAVDVVSRLLANRVDVERSSPLFSEVVLLLGALSAVRSLSEITRVNCLELMCRVLEEDRESIGPLGFIVPEVLAGIGYALSSCGGDHSARILNFLFGIWDKKEGPYNVSHGLMILHWMEWVLYDFLNVHSVEKIEHFINKVLLNPELTHASFAVLMAAAGALRASSRLTTRAGSRHISSRLRFSAEAILEAVAMDLIARIGGHMETVGDTGVSFRLQCLSLAIARCGGLDTKSGSLLICLASALLSEIFPLKKFYEVVLQHPLETLSGLQLNEVKEHEDSVLFKEAGAVAGVLCNLYGSANEDDRHAVENLIWAYCRDIYRGHRQVAFMLRRRRVDQLLADLEKIAESVFLMVVVFASAVTRQRVNSKFLRDVKMDVSVDVLISFSCMEYFRRVHLPEYMDAIRPVVACVQENEAACVSFVGSLPSYGELTNPEGFACLQKMGYVWSEDEVQTARVLFYLRVIATSIDRVPSAIFRNTVTSTMFLYMVHQNVKVSRASHSMFASFISSGKGSDDDDDERVQLKVQLVFYYMVRSLEGFPGNTPFEGLASGVAAIVRSLPAGSPSIFYCIHSLVNKVNSLQRDSDRRNKILGLLIQFLFLVDIQVTLVLFFLVFVLVGRFRYQLFLVPHCILYWLNRRMFLN